MKIGVKGGGERDLRGGGGKADSGARQTKGLRRGERGGGRTEEREREGKRVDSLVAWTGELSVEEEEGCPATVNALRSGFAGQREEERGARRREGRTRRTAERKVPLSSKLEGGAVRIVLSI